jgi:hypothetical protein
MHMMNLTALKIGDAIPLLDCDFYYSLSGFMWPKLSKFPFPNCQNFPFQTVKIVKKGHMDQQPSRKSPHH